MVNFPYELSIFMCGTSRESNGVAEIYGACSAIWDIVVVIAGTRCCRFVLLAFCLCLFLNFSLVFSSFLFFLNGFLLFFIFLVFFLLGSCFFLV